MNTRRWLIRLVQTAILVIVAYFIYRTAANSWDELRDWHGQAGVHPFWLAASLVVYLVGLAPAAWFWKHVLARLGQQQRALPLAAAYFVGNLGKYVPGKAMVIVLRVALLRNRTCSVRTAAASVFYETLTMMAVGGFLGGGLVAILYRDRWLYVLLALAMAFASLIPTLPPVFAWLSKKMGAASSEDVLNEDGYDSLAGEEIETLAVSENGDQRSLTPALRRLDTTVMLTGWGAHLIGWAILGGSLWAVCHALGFEPTEDYSSWHLQAAVCIAATCLAMVAGFLSLIPAGALVRESMILAVLAPAYGKSNALVAAIALRLVWLAGDLLISGVLYATVRRRG